jgi:hypothetical protein
MRATVLDALDEQEGGSRSLAELQDTLRFVASALDNAHGVQLTALELAIARIASVREDASDVSPLVAREADPGADADTVAAAGGLAAALS